MVDHDWNRLYASLKTDPILPSERTKPGVIYALPKPKDEWLDQYERRSNFRLPKSYREFVKVFGPGQFGNGLRLRVPGYCLVGQGQDVQIFNEHVDLEAFNSAVCGGDFTAHVAWIKSRFEEPERIARLVYFSSNGWPDFFGWDPEDLRNTESQEYGIYVVQREEEEKARLVAASFDEFVQREIVQKLDELEEGKDFREALFSPYSRHKAEAPWLSCAKILWSFTK